MPARTKKNSKKKDETKESKKEEKKEAEKQPEREINSTMDLRASDVKKVKLEKINFHSKKLHNTLLVLSIIIPITLVGIYYYAQFIKTQNELHQFRQNPQAVAMQDLLQRVGNHVDLPTNDTPTVATITDADKLKSQSFFSRAQNGDKLLIYQNANRTILYRPTTDKIIETLAVKIENADELTATSETQTNTRNPLLETPKAKESSAADKLNELEEPLTIAIYNGTRVSGLASSTRNSFNKDFKDFLLDVVGIGDAISSYENTLVVPTTEIGKLGAPIVAEFMNAQIQEELEGENPTEADIVIILGLDYANQ